MIYPKLSSWNVKNKRVFVRADLNVPLNKGTIINDFRLKSIIPTIDFLIKQHASIVLATHLGRPKNNEPELSTRTLISWFKNKGYIIHFVEDFNTIAHMPIIAEEIIMLENLRFFPGEKNNDSFFAKQLATTADYYVNDAFGTIHEHECSTTLLPYEFSEDKRSIGFLMEKELSVLNELKNNPQHPFIAILGGGKVKDKIPLIHNLISKVDALLLCPAICFSFLKAFNNNVGKSLVDDTMLETCRQIIHEAEKAHIQYLFPIDYHITYDSLDSALTIVDADKFPNNAIGISIGPKTVAQYTTIINQAKTVFFNCAMGFAERPETQESTKNIIDALAQSSAKTIIAGGDSVDSALNTMHYSRIHHLSTGGGAALAYISDTVLPGLIPFEER